ncbi:MAG TPA: GTPase, partial [Phycisphaerae bacterium]|nr:GTPase [Phycisphaerae bacterium]
DLVELSQRGFTKLFQAHQTNVDAACPNVFSLVPVETKAWRRKLAGQKAELRLWCQEPGCWHMVERGFYPFTINAEWLQAVGPYLGRLVTFLKYAAPLAGPFIGMAAAEYAELLKHHLKMTEELVKLLPDLAEAPEDAHAGRLGFREDPERAGGETFRVLRQLLEQLDKRRRWGGLTKTLTPEGHWLWLCPYHADRYRR